MDDVSRAVAVVLGAVFAYSGFAKCFRLDLSRDAARNLGVPVPLVGVIGVLVPVAELAIAGLLLVPATMQVGAGVAAALLVAFSIVIAANLAGGRRPSCNCFGVTSTKPIGAATLVRNGVLLAAAALCVWQG